MWHLEMIQIVRKFPQRSVLGNEQHVSAISEPEDWSQAVEDPRAYIYSSTLTNIIYNTVYDSVMLLAWKSLGVLREKLQREDVCLF